ncbi:mitochondrial SAM 50 [Blastocystis sp. subtype 4]|uniref:mitochondrial SAM 50 n=1 Tax=Blastocystis sp. subtype 4 TaxID=944170 RepID=UPI00071177F9|nr:mitochondrial SAM 50 [Blastocystis sp. subtype 4]KNB46401.1 mitochondrial SAM 50 [Blastocystis sp. subtype 4]|eukprot:XP_014529844.1 mitochondrial SAM 50 [Blastocystis sp. subtype 4]
MGMGDETRSIVFLREIGPEILNARSFGEAYVALVKMKMNLLALGIFEDVELTMDTADYFSPNDLDVLVHINAKEARPFRIGIQGSVTTSGNDAGIEGSVDYLNVLGFADTLSSRIRYDVMRRNTYYNVNYEIPKVFHGCSFNINYLKESRNLLKESSVNCFDEGVNATIVSPSRHFSLGYSLTWRDMAPATDLDVEKILNNHCSRSMLNECRPSLKSTIFTSLGFDTRNNPVLATSGLFGQLKLGYSGLLGDVHHVKVETNLNANIPVSPMILGEPGLVLHLSSYGGMIRNLSRKNTRYFDRFFLTGEHIRGYEMADIGPRSKPEEGGRKEGDALGGDRCLALGAAVSFPLVFSANHGIGIRGQLFWNLGNIWNRNTHLKKIYHSALQSYGIGVMIPFGTVGRLELNYSLSQKRFSFLFCAM